MASAEAGPPPAPESLRAPVGEIGRDLVEVDDTLLDVAFRHRLGFDAVARLNPEVDVWIPEPGTVIHLPTRFLVPRVDPEGLVINIPEMRLYDFAAAAGLEGLEVFALAIGDAQDPTPTGEFRIGVKRADPVWYVPASIRRARPELPSAVPPGPANPLGTRWMTLGKSSYGIHGTNVRWSIGRPATHGCVRLYEDEMERLFDRTPMGTRVQIVYEPYKWGRDRDALYLEVHPDVYGIHPAFLAAALETPRALGLLDAVDLEAVWRAVEETRGVPVRVGTLRRAESAEPATSTPPS